MTPLWTEELRGDFHRAVERLHAVTENPSEERAYREALPTEATPDGMYTLCLRDELQLADHVAFLAHAQQGPYAVSAACVEEHGSSGLSIRLASNKTPSASTVSGLRKILQTFGEGARLGTPGNHLQDLLFEEVLDLSQDRILQRLRPRCMWIKVPRVRGSGRPQNIEKPLWERVQGMLDKVRSGKGPSPNCSIIPRIDAFISAARALEQKQHDPAQLRRAIKDVIRSCCAISYCEGYRSLEAQLKAFYRGHAFAAKDVRQLDKLARYFGLCRDLGKLSHRVAFGGTDKTLTLETLTAFAAETPAGASRRCHVHAEVQLVLYYEQQPRDRPPQAMGCSKSACFLCDMLLQKLGRYHISYSHRRLYKQWTIPANVPWMAPAQALRFRDILRAMTADISSLAGARGRRPSGFCMESRAVLPLSSRSSLGQAHFAGQPAASRANSAASRPEAAALARALDPDLHVEAEQAVDKGAIVMLDLDKDDLPHHQQLGSRTTTHLDLGGFSLILENSVCSAGSLSIRTIDEEEAGSQEQHGVRRYEAAEIPTSGVELGPTVPSRTRFWLQCPDRSQAQAVEIEVVWRD